MTSLVPLVALLAPGSLLVAGTWAGLRPGVAPRSARIALALATWISVAAAVALAIGVALQGAMVTPLFGWDGLGASLRADSLSLTLLTMISLLAVVIVRFSDTYLDGDARHGAFLGWLATTLASVELLVMSGNLGGFALAWIATSLCLHQLLVFYPERPAARIAGRKKFIVARIGDAALIGAFALLYQRFGTGDLGTIFEAATGGVSASLELPTALIAIAALLKSAQFPTHGWLVEVMETPTPVSALLHAGILNAGPFLVMRYAAVMEQGISAAVILVLFGGFTALFASVVLLTQPAVKVALGYSSAAHMGFMLLVCGLGVYPAAVLHLVAHSFYKAHAFLSSGSVVEVARARAVAVPPRTRSPARILASLALAAGLYFGMATLFGMTPAENPALLAVGAILVMGLSQLLAPTIDARGTLAGMARTSGLAVAVTTAFFTLEEGARRLLLDSLPEANQPPTLIIALAMWVLAAFAVAVLIQIAGIGHRSALGHRVYIHLRNGFYANALFDRLVGALRR